MKKILIIATMVSCLFIFWCNKHSWSDEWFFYDNTLTVEWVFESMENHVMSDEGILVLDWHFEEYADHIYFPKWMRETYFKTWSEYLPWNTIKFMWNIRQFDAWAWNHYYEVVSVYKLETKWYPNKEEVLNIIDSYNYCEMESDCIDFNPGCAFDCSISVNTLFKDIAIKIVNNYNAFNGQFCKRECASTVQMACENNKCIALTQKPMIECTQKDRDHKWCSKEFEPVCGDNLVWYNNPCLACTSQDVNAYSIWWCSQISYFIEWSPKNLEYVLWFLKDNWSVSCNMTYSFKWENLKWKMFADKDRFFEVRDSYYDWQVYHDYSLLSVWWNRYEWQKELPIMNRMYEFTFEILNEIEWVLKATEVFENFSIECHEWIDDESVFNIPYDIDFSME